MQAPDQPVGKFTWGSGVHKRSIHVWPGPTQRVRPGFGIYLEVDGHILDTGQLFELAYANAQHAVVDLGLDAVAICVFWQSQLPGKLAKASLKSLLLILLRLAAAIAPARDSQLVILGLYLHIGCLRSVNGDGMSSRASDILRVAGVQSAAAV